MADDVTVEPDYLERKFSIRKGNDAAEAARFMVEIRDEMEAWANPLYERGYTQMYRWSDPADFGDTITLRVRRPR